MAALNKDDEVKSAILEAARRVFQKWGLNKTTMEDIAHEAGKGKSTLYYYYKSKDEIFHALAIDEFNTIIGKAKSSIDRIQSAKEKLRKYIATMLIETKRTVSIYPLVKGEIKGNKEFIDSLQKQLDDKEEAIIIDILNAGLVSGEFTSLKNVDMNKAANVLLGIIRGLMLYLFLDNEDSEKIDIVTTLLSEGF